MCKSTEDSFNSPCQTLLPTIRMRKCCNILKIRLFCHCFIVLFLIIFQMQAYFMVYFYHSPNVGTLYRDMVYISSLLILYSLRNINIVPLSLEHLEPPSNTNFPSTVPNLRRSLICQEHKILGGLLAVKQNFCPCIRSRTRSSCSLLSFGTFFTSTMNWSSAK